MNKKILLPLTALISTVATAVMATETFSSQTLERTSVVRQEVSFEAGSQNNINQLTNITREHTRIYSYQIDGIPASTLYLKDIPFITFLEKALPENSEGDLRPNLSLTAESAALQNAKTLSDRLEGLANQLQQNQEAGEKIGAHWHRDSKTYQVRLGDEVLLSLNDTTLLADTTENREQDALQIANRLRRLLGDAEPITEVAGKPTPPPVPQYQVMSMAQGMASWYGPGFHGRTSASGEKFNQHALTAAHRTLPFGTKVRVTNLNNGRSVIVRINDRGPYAHRRIIDLSARAAQDIGMVSSGTAPVKLEILGR